ncbi:hypothetical protein DXG01_010742 [Tephrocybe rancida]|nr:hypothetical protein DXG01_010742 [Tephrocybe rancida]
MCERTNSTMYDGTMGGSTINRNLNTIGLSTSEIVHSDPREFTAALDQRRIRRYSVAEEELARQFEKCQAETSPLELQIRALKEATSLLGAHAQDARERAEKLRGLLVDRDMDPDAYESLKRERWLQEHRQGAVDEETLVVQQQLAALGNVSLQPKRLERTVQMAEEERRRRNLCNFLDASNKRSSVRLRKGASVLFERPHKRRTMDRVTPMHLRTTSNLSRASFQPLRPMSLDGWTRRTRHASNRTHSTPFRNLAPSLHLVSEGDSDESISQPAGTASTFTAESYCSTPPTTAATLPTTQIPFTGAKFEPDDENGIATIYLDTYLSGAQYTPEDIDAPLPDYALALFSRFDYNVDINISNTPGRHLPLRSSDDGPQLARKPEKPTPSRHSSSFLEVPSFSPSNRKDHKPPPRLRRSNSQRQLSALFSIPEALSSRIGVESSSKRTRSREPSPPKSSSKASLASSAVSEESVSQPDLSVHLRHFVTRGSPRYHFGTSYPYEPCDENSNRVLHYEFCGRGPPPDDIVAHPGDIYIDQDFPMVLYFHNNEGWEAWNERPGEDGITRSQVLAAHPIFDERFLWKSPSSDKVSWFSIGTINKIIGLTPDHQFALHDAGGGDFEFKVVSLVGTPRKPESGLVRAATVSASPAAPSVSARPAKRRRTSPPIDLSFSMVSHQTSEDTQATSRDSQSPGFPMEDDHHAMLQRVTSSAKECVCVLPSSILAHWSETKAILIDLDSITCVVKALSSAETKERNLAVEVERATANWAKAKELQKAAEQKNEILLEQHRVAVEQHEEFKKKTADHIAIRELCCSQVLRWLV